MSSRIRMVNRAWESMLTAHTHLLREFAADPVWKEHDLSMREYDVLYTLTKIGHTARVGDLQSGVLLSQPALSRLVDRLVERGLLSREADPLDKRAVHVKLTDAGSQLQRTVGRIHAEAVQKRVGEHLADHELAELQRLTQKLLH